MPRVSHIIGSLRGGLNENAPATIADDQCTVAENVEWVRSPLGERRRGAVGISLAGSGLAACAGVVWLHRHLPTSNLADAQLWGLGLMSFNGPAVLSYKDTVWHDVAMPDPLVPDGRSEFHIDGQSLHGKLFIAYRSTVNRLHVWDGTTFRRTGLAGNVGGAPSPIVTTGSGTFTGFRYYRVRFVVLVGGVVTRRSEPSNSNGFAPPGTGAGAQVTRPAGMGEGETHWELEASQDNVLYYRVATTVMATTTAIDTTPYNGYTTVGGTGYPLSDDIGDQNLIPSCRFLSVDEDRLLCASSWDDPSITSRVMWTPVAGATGIGNDERLALDTNPSLDLDTYEGGDITNLSGTVNGYIYATKWRHIYQLARTGVPTRAYEAIPLTKQRGGIPGSMVEGFDQGGKPFVFILDPDVGPCLVGGAAGIEPCGGDLVQTWPLINIDAAVPSRALYYPETRQVFWWLAYPLTANNISIRLVLHTNLMRRDPEGTRGGFAIWGGGTAGAFAACLYADNIDTGGPRTRRLKPFIGQFGAPLICRTDTGDTDYGVTYVAKLRTKAVVRQGLLDQFECGEAQLMTTAVPDAKLDVTLIGMRSDKTRVRKLVSGIDLTPQVDEGEHVIHSLDNLSLAELQTIQVEIADSATDPTPGPRWSLELLSMTLTGGQQSRG